MASVRSMNASLLHIYYIYNILNRTWPRPPSGGLLVEGESPPPSKSYTHTHTHTSHPAANSKVKNKKPPPFHPKKNEKLEAKSRDCVGDCPNLKRCYSALAATSNKRRASCADIYQENGHSVSRIASVMRLAGYRSTVTRTTKSRPIHDVHTLHRLRISGKP